MIASHSSSFMRSSRLSRVMPALLTRIAMSPNSLLDRRRARRRSLRRRSRRAPCRCPRCRPPAGCASIVAAPSSVVAVPTTVAPCGASAQRDRAADAARGAGDQCDSVRRSMIVMPLSGCRAARPRSPRRRSSAHGLQIAARCAWSVPPAPCPARIRRRASRRCAAIALHRSRPSAPDSPPAAPARRGSRRASRAVATSTLWITGIVGVAIATLGEILRASCSAAGLQQRAVKRRAHRQQHAALRAPRLGQRRSRARPPRLCRRSRPGPAR